MKFLILGGTVFLGRHLIEAAIASGHDLTLFNRGQHNADLYPDLEKFRGDRDGGLDALKGRTWDAVVDTCGYVPRLVRDSACLLADAVEHYTKATADGLVFRPLSETINDTLNWAQHRPDTDVWQAGLTPEREARILAQWYQVQKSSCVIAEK